MLMNTTFKAFVAETAAKVAAHLAESKIEDDLKKDNVAEDIAIASVNVAEQLAYKLQEWWKCKGDHSTVMFDVQDSLTSNLEREINDVSGKLEGIETQLKCGLRVVVIDDED